MKVQIVKYLNPKGKVVEMRKDNFKGRDLPEKIIEEYEVEIKGEDSNETDWLEDLKRKYESDKLVYIDIILGILSIMDDVIYIKDENSLDLINSNKKFK